MKLLLSAHHCETIAQSKYFGAKYQKTALIAEEYSRFAGGLSRDSSLRDHEMRRRFMLFKIRVGRESSCDSCQ